MTPAPRPLDPSSTAFLFLIGFATAMQAMATTFTLPALPVIAADFGSTPATAQLTITGFLIGLACGQILAGALSDRFGRRPILLIGAGLFVLAGVGCTVAGSMDQLIAMRVAQGFAGAAGMILGRAIVRDTFEGSQAVAAMSTIVAIMAILPMVGPPIAGVLLQFLSWRAIFAVLTGVSLVIALLIFFCVGESLRAPDPHATDPVRIARNCLEMMRRPDAISFVLIVCAAYGGAFVFFTLMPFILFDTFGLGVASAGWFFGLTSLATWFGARINNRVARRWPVRQAMRMSTLLMFASSLLTLAATWVVTQGWLHGVPGLLAIVVPLLLYCFAQGIVHPTSIVMALQPVPHIAGTGSALQASFQTLAGALFASFAAHLYTGTPLALGLGMALAGATAFFLFVGVAAKYAPAEHGPR